MNEIIRAKRIEKGISQGALARLLKVTQGSVSQWEKGTTSPKVSTLPRLAAALGVTVDELIGKAG